MFKIGLTGGIGSGKSQAADLFKQWGAAVIDTDVIAHELTAPNGAAIQPILSHFGPAMISPEGALNRAAMRELVFKNPEARKELESIVHPLIAMVTHQQAQSASGCYLVFVVPLLVESGRWRSQVDRICVVDCDPATQVARVQTRSGLTPEAIGRIMSAQASRQVRLDAADDIIVNDAGTTFAQLEQRARKLHDHWCQLAADRHR